MGTNRVSPGYPKLELVQAFVKMEELKPLQSPPGRRIAVCCNGASSVVLNSSQKKLDLCSSFLSDGFDFSNGNRYSPPRAAGIAVCCNCDFQRFHLNVSKTIWVLSHDCTDDFSNTENMLSQVFHRFFEKILRDVFFFYVCWKVTPDLFVDVIDFFLDRRDVS